MNFSPNPVSHPLGFFCPVVALFFVYCRLYAPCGGMCDGMVATCGVLQLYLLGDIGDVLVLCRPGGLLQGLLPKPVKELLSCCALLVFL